MNRFLGLFLFISIFVSGCFLFSSDSPEEVLSNMQHEMQELDSVALKGTLSGTYNNGEADGTFSLDLQGVVANPSATNANADLTGLLNAATPGTDPFTLGLGIKIIESTDIFFRINTEQSPEFAFAGDDWYRLPNQEDFRAMFGAEVVSDAKDEDLTEEQREKIEELSKNAQLLTLVEDKGKEKVNGVSTYHYIATVDQDALGKLIDETNEISNSEITTEEKQALFELLSDLRINLWIGQNDSYIYKVVIDEFTITDPAGEGDENVTLSMEFNLSDHGDTVTVQPPAFAKSVFELFFPLMMGGFDDTSLFPTQQGQAEVMPPNFGNQISPDQQAEIDALLEAYQ